MLFWVIAAFLTLGACLAILLPMSGRGKRREAPGAHDLEVYRDQFAEVDRDAARGLIGKTEAEQAKAEIGRRILRAGAPDRYASGRDRSGALRWMGLAAVLALPLASWSIYAAIGSPELPAQPLQERLAKNPAQNTLEELVARAEAHLAANPEDGRGWEVLAPIYLRMGRDEEATVAFGNAIRLLGVSAAREAGLGAALARTADAGDPEAGPTPTEVDAAGEMSTADRGAIEGMVASLDERLRRNPRDLEGWKRLIRSYMVLGKPDEARDALERGVEAVGADTVEAREMEVFSAGLGMIEAGRE